MVRHIHMDVIRARAARMAIELGVDPELIAHQLAEAHARTGRFVERPDDHAVQKHYASGRLVSVKPIPVKRFIGTLPVTDFQPTVQV